MEMSQISPLLVQNSQESQASPFMTPERMNRAVDGLYQRYSVRWQNAGMDQPAMIRETTLYAKKLGIMPDSGRAMLRASLNSQDARSAHAAALAYQEIERSGNQMLIDKLDADERKFARSLAILTDAYGGNAEMGLTAARKAIEARASVGGPQLEADFKQFMSEDGAFTKHILDDLDSTIGVDVSSMDDLPPGMRDEWEEVARAEYMRTGNKTAAMAAADSRVTGKWQKSELTGKIESYPMTKVYANSDGMTGQGNQWLLNQAATSIATALKENSEQLLATNPELLTGADKILSAKESVVQTLTNISGQARPSTVSLFTESTKAKSSGDFLSGLNIQFVPGSDKKLADGSKGHLYFVWYTGNDGQPYQLFNKDGTPFIIRPNYESTPQAAVTRERERQQTMDFRRRGAAPSINPFMISPEYKQGTNPRKVGA